MKYIVWILIIGAGWYHYEKSQLWSDDNLVKSILGSSERVCSIPEMLNYYGKTKEQCKNNFSAKVMPCLAERGEKTSGDMYDSQEQFEQTSSNVLNCINKGLQ